MHGRWRFESRRNQREIRVGFAGGKSRASDDHLMNGIALAVARTRDRLRAPDDAVKHDEDVGEQFAAIEVAVRPARQRISASKIGDRDSRAAPLAEFV
jgi:hypothetical protein